MKDAHFHERPLLNLSLVGMFVVYAGFLCMENFGGGHWSVHWKLDERRRPCARGTYLIYSILGSQQRRKLKYK